MTDSNVLSVLSELEEIEQVAASAAPPVLDSSTELLEDATSAVFEALDDLATSVTKAKNAIAMFSEALKEALEEDDGDIEDSEDSEEDK